MAWRAWGINGKIGFIDRTGNFAIEPVFDRAREFRPGFGRTSAEQDGTAGVIDRAGMWVFQTNYQQIYPLLTWGRIAVRHGVRLALQKG